MKPARNVRQVVTLPGEPEVYADALGCAYHANGEPVWWSEVDADESGKLLAVLERHNLKARNEEFPYNRALVEKEINNG